VSGPLADGGQSFTLPPGSAAQLLTEYAAGPGSPLVVINTSGDVAYLAGNSSVGPSNGVPLAPGTSIPWTTPGQVWAVADPAAAAAVTVVITGAIAVWTPSPAAIAAATAIALAESGIPITASETVLAFNTTLNVAKTYPIATYNSLILLVETAQLEVIQKDADGAVVDIQYVQPASPAPFGVAFPVRIAAIGVTATVTPTGAGVPIIFLVGSTRTSPRIDSRLADAAGDEWKANGAMTVGTEVALVQTNQNTKLQGPVAITFTISGTVVTGRFLVAYTDGLGNNIERELADTAQFVTPSGTGGNRMLNINDAMPAVPYAITFQPSTAGSASVAARMIAATI
jgi:hypothetical protein